MLRSVLLAVLASACGAALLRRPEDRPFKLMSRCPSLDSLPVVCQYGGVSVLAGSQGLNQRKLRFGDECAVETVVSCKGPMPGDGTCGGGCTPCPCEFDDSIHTLSAPYMRTMFESMAPWCSSAGATQVLSIGLGGGELPQFLLRRCPNMRIETVELNEEVIHVATNFFGLGESQSAFGDRVSVEHADALAAVEERALSRYDAVLVDCFAGGGRVPETCRSRRFAEKVRGILKPSGVLLQNIWRKSPRHPEVAADFSATITTYGEVFHGAVEDLAVPMPPNLRFVDILKATKLAP